MLFNVSQKEVFCVTGHDEDEDKAINTNLHSTLLRLFLVAGKDGLQSHNVLCDRT